jgi:hypothetical protein
MAGALGVRLGGTNSYDGESHHGEYLGDARQLLDFEAPESAAPDQLRFALNVALCCCAASDPRRCGSKRDHAGTSFNQRFKGGLYGGRVYEAARRWNVAPEAVIDFSSNINPLGPPPRVLAEIQNISSLSILRAYPDTYSFVMALAERHWLMPDEIIVGSERRPHFARCEPFFLEGAHTGASFRKVRASVCGSQCDDHHLVLSERHCFAPDFVELTRSLTTGSLIW